MLRDGAGEEEGFFKVSFDGFGSWVFLHALIAHATVCEEYGDLAALVSGRFVGGGGGGGVTVFVIGGGGGGLGHFWSFGFRLLLDFHDHCLRILQLSIAGVPLHLLYALVNPRTMDPTLAFRAG